MQPSGRGMRQRAQRRPSTGASRLHPQAVRAEPRARYVARAGLVGPLLGGVAAAVGAVGTMALLRSTLQVRTVSERLLEWVLLLVPPGLLEAALQRFGFDAKRYALYIAILATLATLTVLGTVVLGRRWPGYARRSRYRRPGP